MNGALKSDHDRRRAPARAVARLTTTKSCRHPPPAGAPQHAGRTGRFGTNKDGTLTLDLDRAGERAQHLSERRRGDSWRWAAAPRSTGNGLAAALSAIATQATDPTYGLDVVDRTTTPSSKATVTDEQTDQTTKAAATKTQLTQQYAAMDSKIAAYKSTQTFLTAQIATVEQDVRHDGHTPPLLRARSRRDIPAGRRRGAHLGRRCARAGAVAVRGTDRRTARRRLGDRRAQLRQEGRTDHPRDRHPVRAGSGAGPREAAARCRGRSRNSTRARGGRSSTRRSATTAPRSAMRRHRSANWRMHGTPCGRGKPHPSSPRT